MSLGQRIKYIDHKYKKNHRISTRSYVSQNNGAKYRTILNLTDMEYYIRNERTKEYVFKSGTYTNLNVLKRNARAKLEEFGVSLKKESRDRQFGRCKSGYNQKTHEMLQSIEINKDEL
tara:strand:- start:3306 stop:3659 length:354 start_codon:yes stop_codon:yes gene_type:complete